MADVLQIHAVPASLWWEAWKVLTLSHPPQRDSPDFLVNVPAHPMATLISAWRNGSQHPFLEAARTLRHTGSDTLLQPGPLIHPIFFCSC